MHEKVVGLSTSRRCVGGEPKLVSGAQLHAN